MEQHETCGEENCAFCSQFTVHVSVVDHHEDGSATISQWIFAPGSYAGVCDWLRRAVGVPQVEFILSEDDVQTIREHGSSYATPIVSYAEEEGGP